MNSTGFKKPEHRKCRSAIPGVIALALLIGTTGCGRVEPGNRYEEFLLKLIPRGSRNLAVVTLWWGTASVDYKIKEKYPASKIQQFYARKLYSLGFQPFRPAFLFDEHYPPWKWSFVVERVGLMSDSDKAAPVTFVNHSLVACWRRGKENRMVRLYMRYKSKGSSQDERELYALRDQPSNEFLLVNVTYTPIWVEEQIHRNSVKATEEARRRLQQPMPRRDIGKPRLTNIR
jgi:hypothetical protein